jgi:hypothetical protein
VTLVILSILFSVILSEAKDLLFRRAKPKRLLFPAVIVIAVSCSAFRHRSSLPEIEKIQPDSVLVPSGAVIELTIRGKGFLPGTPGRNTVQFGTASITNVPANDDGTQIRFVVPTSMPSGGEAAPLPLESGSYPIRIQTTTGSSNAVIVRVFR